MTCNGSISVHVDTKLFFEHVSIAAPNAQSGILWASMWHGGNRLTRGVHPAAPAQASKTWKPFENQATIVYRLGEKCTPNTKLFVNGNVHITGVRSVTDGYSVVCAVADEVRRIAQTINPAIITHGQTPDDVDATDFCVRMINSDFNVGYQIRRPQLHNLLISDYRMLCSFHPGTYPGVKLSFFWNSDYPAAEQGVCACRYGCLGDGLGTGEGQCKRVCVAVFQSGTVLITGAAAMVQVEAAYNFISRVLHEHRDELMMR